MILKRKLSTSWEKIYRKPVNMSCNCFRWCFLKETGSKAPMDSILLWLHKITTLSMRLSVLLLLISTAMEVFVTNTYFNQFLCQCLDHHLLNHLQALRLHVMQGFTTPCENNSMLNIYYPMYFALEVLKLQTLCCCCVMISIGSVRFLYGLCSLLYLLCFMAWTGCSLFSGRGILSNTYYF